MEQFLQLLLLLFSVFDLLPDPFGNCFGIDFGLLSMFGSFLVLVLDSSYVYFVSVFGFTPALVSFFISSSIVIRLCSKLWFRAVFIPDFIYSCSMI